MRDLFNWYCSNPLRIAQSFNHLSKKSSDLLLASKQSSEMIVKMMKVMILVKNDNWTNFARLPPDLPGYMDFFDTLGTIFHISSKMVVKNLESGLLRIRS